VSQTVIGTTRWGVRALTGPPAPFPLNPQGYADKPTWEPFPAPLVTSEDDQDGPGKTAVAGLVAMAAQWGWAVRVTYAKGWMTHGTTGRPSEHPRESLLVRMSRGDRRAVARYVDGGSSWSWDTLRAWKVGEFPQAVAGFTEFQAAVFGPVHGPSLADAKLGPMLGPKRPTKAQLKVAAGE
jgi:hypothetical protein